MRSVFSIVAGAAITLSVGTARADRPDPVAAEALFRAARAASDRGDYTSACAQFDESNRLDPAVGTMFNLAACDEQLGKIASAWQLFREVAQRLPPGDDRIAIANRRARALEPKLPSISLQAAALPSGTSVLRDGIELGTASLGLPLPFDPGDHVIVVKSPGRADRRYEVTAAVGQSRELALEVGAVLPGDGLPLETPAPRDSAGDQGDGSRRTLGLALMGLGGGGIVTGLAFGGVALAAKHTVDAECENKRCSSAGLDAADRGSTAATVSTVAIGVGVVSAAVGAALFFGAKSTASARGGVSPPVAFGVSPLSKGAFVSAMGRWW
jgi:hypothetical protein